MLKKFLVDLWVANSVHYVHLNKSQKYDFPDIIFTNKLNCELHLLLFDW